MTSSSAWIEHEQDPLIEDWREAFRIPSVSSDGPGSTDAMTAWILRRAEPIFDPLVTYKTPEHGPVLIGDPRGRESRRLLLYSHPDVVPPGESWSLPPFGAEIRDRTVFARGASDDKADVVARLHALEC